MSSVPRVVMETLGGDHQESCLKVLRGWRLSPSGQARAELETQMWSWEQGSWGQSWAWSSWGNERARRGAGGPAGLEGDGASSRGELGCVDSAPAVSAVECGTWRSWRLGREGLPWGQKWPVYASREEYRRCRGPWGQHPGSITHVVPPGVCKLWSSNPQPSAGTSVGTVVSSALPNLSKKNWEAMIVQALKQWTH